MAQQKRKPRNNWKQNNWIKREIKMALDSGIYIKEKIAPKESNPIFANITASDVNQGFRNKILTKKFGNHNNPWDRM